MRLIEYLSSPASLLLRSYRSSAAPGPWKRQVIFSYLGSGLLARYYYYCLRTASRVLFSAS